MSEHEKNKLRSLGILKDKKAFFNCPLNSEDSILIVVVVNIEILLLVEYLNKALLIQILHGPSLESMPAKSWTKKLGCGLKNSL